MSFWCQIEVLQEEAARNRCLTSTMRQLIVELGISLAFSRQSGEKGFTFSQLYQMKCRCCWRCLWWENISHWNWKWVICNAGNLNYQLHVAQHWGVGWVHFIWIGSLMTNTQRHQLSLAEQCNKAIWGQNQRQADALSWEMPAMWHSCPALPRGAPFPDARVTFA